MGIGLATGCRVRWDVILGDEGSKYQLSILSGHNRYAHMASLMGDLVNTQMLGLSKAVSDDSARRALKKMDAEDIRAFEYAVLVTPLNGEVLTIV